MKSTAKLSLVLIVATIYTLLTSCKKEQSSVSSDENYASIKDFHTKNGVVAEHFTVSASSGGKFTTQKGTTVRIPANAFVDNLGNAITGNVDIEFKDIYSKSDMLLSDIPTTTLWGTPLKSGGEFFIRAKLGNTAVDLNPANPIVVVQPIVGAAKVDTMMQPFVGINNPLIVQGFAWFNDSLKANTVKDSASSYVFSLYHFTSPVDSGTWCNSDNSTYFYNYPQTVLSLRPTDNADSFHTDVFLVFKNINSMVHVYRGYNPSFQEFPYPYAPVGLECTVVAVGVKDKTLYSSFTPITISNNQIVNFTLSSTTTTAFIAQLKLLN